MAPQTKANSQLTLLMHKYGNGSPTETTKHYERNSVRAPSSDSCSKSKKYVTRISQTNVNSGQSLSSPASSTDSGCYTANPDRHSDSKRCNNARLPETIVLDNKTNGEPQVFVVNSSKDFYSCEAIGGISTANSYWATKTCLPYHSVDVVAIQKTINNKQQFYLQSAQQQRAQQQSATEDQKRAAAWPFSRTTSNNSTMSLGTEKGKAALLRHSPSSSSIVSNENGYATPPPLSQPETLPQKDQTKRQLVSITLQLQPLEIALAVAQPEAKKCLVADVASQQASCAHAQCSVTQLRETKVRNSLGANKSVVQNQRVRPLAELCKNPVSETNKLIDPNSITKEENEWTIQSVGNAMCITLAGPPPLTASSTAAVHDMTTIETLLHEDITMPSRRSATRPTAAAASHEKMAAKNADVRGSKSVVLINSSASTVSVTPVTLSSSAVSSGSASSNPQASHATPPSTNTSNSDADDGEYEEEESEDELHHPFDHPLQPHRDSSYESVDGVDFEMVGNTTGETKLYPKKLTKPWQELPNAKELQNELLFNEKMGIDVLKTKRSEFKKILNKIRDTQHKRESAERNKTDLERAFEKRRVKQSSDILIISPDETDLKERNVNANDIVLTIGHHRLREQTKDNELAPPRKQSSVGAGFSKQPDFVREFYQRSSKPKAK